MKKIKKIKEFDSLDYSTNFYSRPNIFQIIKIFKGIDFLIILLFLIRVSKSGNGIRTDTHMDTELYHIR